MFLSQHTRFAVAIKFSNSYSIVILVSFDGIARPDSARKWLDKSIKSIRPPLDEIVATRRQCTI